MNLLELQNQFKVLFNEEASHKFFAPGRVNLIGEHIDYNGGLVFPCAITLGTYALVSVREDKNFAVYSENFKELGTMNLSLHNLDFKKEDNWTNYLKGVLKYLLEADYEITHGLNILVYGNIPNGSGLSSSASLEILLSKVFSTLYDLELKPTEMALLGKKVENEYMGVSSGIMDQFAIALGQENSALLLNCGTQDFEHIPFKLDDYQIVIMNTNKRRELADSKYNECFNECTQALKILQDTYPHIKAICDLGEKELATLDSILTNPILYKRAKHAISENLRVISATKALASNDLVTFGKLLNASHTSLKEDYEVTGKELDTLVSAALEEEGTLGARMTGAGFGGCAIAIVQNDKVSDFMKHVGDKYEAAIGYPATFYIASIGNGPSEL